MLLWSLYCFFWLLLLPVYPYLTFLRTSLFLFFCARNFSTLMSLLPLASQNHSLLETNCFSLGWCSWTREELPSAFSLFSLLSFNFLEMPLQFSEFRRIFSPQNKWRKTSEQHPCFTQTVLGMLVRVWCNIESTTTNFSHHEHHFLRKNTTKSNKHRLLNPDYNFWDYRLKSTQNSTWRGQCYCCRIINWRCKYNNTSSLTELRSK